MKELKIIDVAAIQAYNNTDKAGQKLLTDLFGKEVFNQNITDRVKTFEDACEVLGLRPTDVLPLIPNAFSREYEAITAHTKLLVIARALNEGWEPDWNNGNQVKYYPYFNMQNGFSLGSYGSGCQLSRVGSRLCFKSSSIALYAGKQFLELYKIYMTL